MQLLKKLRCTMRYEKRAWESGATLVAGVDEVGRGSLFGPVVAAAVILDPAYRIRGLRDSKLLLPERREVLEKRILEHVVAWSWMRHASTRSTFIMPRSWPCATR
jgi:ribonuclease HII